MSDTDTPRVRIVNTTGCGFETKVYIDDRDVSECFRAVRISAGLRGAVVVELEPTLCEITVTGDAAKVVFPNEETRELLIRHGWTAPIEPVTVPVVRKTVNPTIMSNFACQPDRVHRSWPSEPLDIEADLFAPYGEQIDGRGLLGRFFERVQREWEPNDHDELTVERVYDEDGYEIVGRREYTLRLTMDANKDSVQEDAVG